MDAMLVSPLPIHPGIPSLCSISVKRCILCRDTAQYAQAAEAVAHRPSQQLLEQAAGSHSPTRQRSIGTPRSGLLCNRLGYHIQYQSLSLVMQIS